MDEKGSPPPYPGTGSSPGAGYSTNYQPEYSNQGYQNSGGHPAYMQAPPNQPFISQQQQQQQQMMSNTVVVGGMGGGMGAPVYQPLPDDYTTKAWLACLCCFWPTGLLAIMKASESRDALARGDVMGAHTAANSARQMVRISYIIGVISIILSGVIFGVYYGLIVNQYYNNSY